MCGSRCRGFLGKPEVWIPQVSFPGPLPFLHVCPAHVNCQARPQELPTSSGSLALGLWRNQQVPFVGCLEASGRRERVVP